VAVLLAAAALDLGRALVTHRGVGPIEWIVGAAGVALLVAAAFHYSRRSINRI
jgi:hypothetical protein